MTGLVNIKKARCEVYIGRGTPFGNPYVIGENGTREDVIRLYRTYFYDRLKKEPDWKKKVEALKGKVLGCHCAPLGCHGNILIDYLDKGIKE